MGNSRVTVRQVAELAGVSIATVSRVSRGSDQVSPELRDKVLRVIAEQGYRPSHLGRALAENRHGALALVFPGLSGPYFSELIQGFESEALDSGSRVHVVAAHSRADTDDAVIDLAGRVDGMAVQGGTVSEHALERAAAQVRVVMMAGDSTHVHATVRVENGSVQELTRHLLVDHGYRRLAFVGYNPESPDVHARFEAFRAAHRAARRRVPTRVLEVGLQQSDGVLAARDLLDGADPADRPDAVVCANDETALGFMIGALGRGLRVPEDVAITGFDDMPMASLVQPTLTTVRQPVRELAATTARLLLDRSTERGEVLLPTEVVLRGSCGCRNVGGG